MDERDYFPDSDEKVCSINDLDDQGEIDRLKSFVRNSRYVCSTCGRSAANADNLCSPETL